METTEPSQYYEPTTCHITFDDSSFEQIEIEQNQPFDIGERLILNSSQEIVVSEKKYAFNPLSKPFTPGQNIYSSYVSSPMSFTSSSSDCSTIESPTETNSSIFEEETKQFVCILCPEKFTTLDDLNEHIKNKIQNPYRCNICGKSYDDHFLFQRHLRSHRRLKTFKCRGCSKKFRSLHQLNKHFDLCRYKLYIFI